MIFKVDKTAFNNYNPDKSTLTKEVRYRIRGEYTGARGDKKRLKEKYGLSSWTIDSIVGSRKRPSHEMKQNVRSQYLGRHGDIKMLMERYGLSRQVITRIVKDKI